uniref:DNA primase n=1 Tax=Pithovirus LCPAC202 TaxID=2506592 RepID=A0A481Z5K2_9VIRU|nr:MAG: DNA primase [Pithovirus LCPAC202]
MSLRSSGYTSSNRYQKKYQKKYEYINGRKWYYYLKPNKKKRKVLALLSQHSWDQVNDGMVIHLATKDTRLFTLFQNPFQFLEYEKNITPSKRCFFETVFGQSQQKPHFDIDIDLTKETSPRINQEVNEMMNELILAIILVLEEAGIFLDLERDMLIFTSHGLKKKSFHIVIDHYYHSDHKEAKAFYQLVVSKVHFRYRHWIDGMVYSSLQQFRLEGSQKSNSGRVKTLQEEWKLNGSIIKYKFAETPINPIHQRGMIFSASLLSYNRTGQLIPSFIIPVDPTSKINYDSLSLTDREGMMALEMVAKLAGVSISHPAFPYQYIKTERGLVVLKRIHPSNCRVCNRIHENENPYLIIVGENKNVYFDCRRNEENRRLFVGRLSSSENDELSREKELTMEELMKMPVMVPTVDDDGLIISNPVTNLKPTANLIPKSNNSGELPSVEVIPVLIPKAPPSIRIAIYPTPVKTKSAMANLQILSRGSTYKTKSGKTRGKKKSLGVYSPPMDLLKDLVF